MTMESLKDNIDNYIFFILYNIYYKYKKYITSEVEALLKL